VQQIATRSKLIFRLPNFISSSGCDHDSIGCFISLPEPSLQLVAADSDYESFLQPVVLPDVALQVSAAMVLPFNILHAGLDVPIQMQLMMLQIARTASSDSCLPLL
jgi:hypothetical protein